MAPEADHLSWAQNVVSWVFPFSIGQSCVVLATISPLLAYPFLPHENLGPRIFHWDLEQRRYNYYPAICLENMCQFQLLIHFFIALWSAGKAINGSTAPPIPITSGVICLTIFSLVASHSAVRLSLEDDLRPSNFKLAGRWACYSILYFLFRAFNTILDQAPTYAFALAALIMLSISESVAEYVMKHTHAYLTRNVSYLAWLWPTRGADDFGPVWSTVLLLVVFIGQATLMIVGLVEAYGDY